MSLNFNKSIDGAIISINMLMQGGGTIVNQSSVSGLTTRIDKGMYRMTEHAVVSLSETLAIQLGVAGAPIGVSVVCPGEVATDIALATVELAGGIPEDIREIAEKARDGIAAGMDPKEVADIVFAAIQDRRLYVITHADSVMNIESRFEGIRSACAELREHGAA